MREYGSLNRRFGPAKVYEKKSSINIYGNGVSDDRAMISNIKQGNMKISIVGNTGKGSCSRRNCHRQEKLKT